VFLHEHREERFVAEKISAQGADAPLSRVCARA
jgi:hypothetical protein